MGEVFSIGRNPGPDDPSRRVLSFKTITQGSKIVIPLYPLLFLALGAIFIFQGSTRTSGVAYDVAKSVFPIHTWGAIFLIVGIAETASWWRKNRRLFMNTLVVGSSLCGFWAALFFVAAVEDNRVSWTGTVWLLFATGCHVASVRSLSRDFVLGDDEKG